MCTHLAIAHIPQNFSCHKTSTAVSTLLFEYDPKVGKKFGTDFENSAVKHLSAVSY